MNLKQIVIIALILIGGCYKPPALRWHWIGPYAIYATADDGAFCRAICEYTEFYGTTWVWHQTGLPCVIPNDIERNPCSNS
jgi:hypothetical protein